MKYKVLIPFVDKNTKKLYGKNEVIDLTEKRVKEILSKNKDLIEKVEENKEEVTDETKAEAVEETENKEEVEETEEVKETKEEKIGR